jgi:hypothetical protein
LISDPDGSDEFLGSGQILPPLAETITDPNFSILNWNDYGSVLQLPSHLSHCFLHHCSDYKVSHHLVSSFLFFLTVRGFVACLYQKLLHCFFSFLFSLCSLFSVLWHAFFITFIRMVVPVKRYVCWEILTSVSLISLFDSSKCKRNPTKWEHNILFMRSRDNLCHNHGIKEKSRTKRRTFTSCRMKLKTVRNAVPAQCSNPKCWCSKTISSAPYISPT